PLIGPEGIAGRWVNTGRAVIAEIGRRDTGVLEAGCALDRHHRRPHGAGRVAYPVHHDAHRWELRRGCPRTPNADVAPAVHRHGGGGVGAVGVAHKPLLEEGAVADPHLVPEDPRARAGRALGPVAAEHAAAANEGAVVPPAPGFHQFHPAFRLDPFHP